MVLVKKPLIRHSLGAAFGSVLTAQDVVGSVLLVFHELHLAFECGVEVVLDVVVCASWQELRDFGPSVAELLVRLNDQHVFLLGPLVLLDIRIEMIMPSMQEKILSSRDTFLGTAFLSYPEVQSRFGSNFGGRAFLPCL